MGECSICLSILCASRSSARNAWMGFGPISMPATMARWASRTAHGRSWSPRDSRISRSPRLRWWLARMRRCRSLAACRPIWARTRCCASPSAPICRSTRSTRILPPLLGVWRRRMRCRPDGRWSLSQVRGRCCAPCRRPMPTRRRRCLSSAARSWQTCRARRLRASRISTVLSMLWNRAGSPTPASLMALARFARAAAPWMCTREI